MEVKKGGSAALPPGASLEPQVLEESDLLEFIDDIVSLTPFKIAQFLVAQADRVFGDRTEIAALVGHPKGNTVTCFKILREAYLAGHEFCRGRRNLSEISKIFVNIGAVTTAVSIIGGKPDIIIITADQATSGSTR